MKITLNDILALAFVILLSLVLKKFLLIPLVAIAIVYLLGKDLDSCHKNLAYLAAMMIPFLPFLVFFLFYLPFTIFGILLSKRSFIKSYVLGLSIILILRIFLYHLTMLGVPLTKWTILFTTLLFLSISYSFFIKKNGMQEVKNTFKVDGKEFRILLGTLFFLFFVSQVIYNNTSLYGSNGTQIYAKQKFVIDSIEKYGKFPLYDPGIGMGEQLFLTDSPTHFIKDILVLATIWLRPWFGEVLIYNAYHMFILWMVMLAASVLLRELLSREGKDNSALTHYFVILGSIAIALSFVFVRLLESFKAFSAHPINLLLLALLFTKPKKPLEWLVIGYLMLFSYMVHAIQAMGVFVLAVSILIVMYVRDWASVRNGFSYLLSHKVKAGAIVLIFIAVMFGYTATGYITKDYLRQSNPGIIQPNPWPNTIGWFFGFFENPDITILSIHYPDLRRIDTKHSGFFLSVIGGISFLILLFAFKHDAMGKSSLFCWAFVLQFILYGISTNIINVGNLEPGYRIVLPYAIVALAISFCALFDALKNIKMKAVIAIVCLAFLVHSFYYVNINMGNIHSSSIISKNVFPDVIAAIERLPIDGRFITYGHFSNEVDAGIASSTGRYFTRYQYNLWSSKNNIYELVHTQHSFGEFPELAGLSGAQLHNYWALGGYKYMFINACHPVGNTILQKAYPNYTQPFFQSEQNKCLILAKVNNVSYAEKVSVLKEVDDVVYKREDGYYYLTVSDLSRYHVDRKAALNGVSNSPSPPQELSFKRTTPQEVEISGDFRPGDWVNFKEEYFFRWRAYMDGKEVPVYPSNFNMILIKVTEPGTSIHLVYDILPSERIFHIISLIGTFLCAALFLLLLRRPEWLD